jgi:hypothetical protein
VPFSATRVPAAAAAVKAVKRKKHVVSRIAHTKITKNNQK